MSTAERIFLVVLLCNLLVVLAYAIWNESYWRLRNRARCVSGRFHAVIMLLAPVLGVLFFGGAYVLDKLLFRQDADLADVIFSKERVKTHQKADEEREGNMVPIEEALAISDRDSLRALILNVIRGDVQDSLASLALALDSEDSETAHYAATVLRDALNDFRAHTQTLYNRMTEARTDAAPIAVELIEYMHGVLEQEVFRDSEQLGFVNMYEDACMLLYEKFQHALTPQYIEWLNRYLLRLSDYGRMRKWCAISREVFPDALSSYTDYLKLYFTCGRKKEFFAELERLKASNVVIDRETLALIRTYQ